MFTPVQLWILALAATLTAGLVAWRFRSWRFRRRVLAAMAERGETPVKPPPAVTGPGSWIGVVCTIALIVLMLYFQPRANAWLGRPWGALAVWVVFIAALAGVGSFTAHLRRDRVMQRALELAEAGEVDLAIAKLRAVMRREGETASRTASVASILIYAGRPADAAVEYARAAELDPGDLSFPVQQSLTLAASGQHAAATAVIEAVRRRLPQDGGLALAAALVLAHAGRVDEAREQQRQAEELLRAFPNDQRLYPQLTVELRKGVTDRVGPAAERAFMVAQPMQVIPAGESPPPRPATP